MEGVEHLQRGLIAAGKDAVFVARMPGKSGVEMGEELFTGHKGLGGQALFTGAAVQLHRAAALALFLEVGLHSQRRAHRADTQQMVTAAVTAAAVAAGVHSTCLLLEAVKGVILGKETDDGLAAAERGTESGLDTGDAALHGEALVFQKVCQASSGAILLQRELGKAPNAVRESREVTHATLQQGIEILFCHSMNS